MFRKLLDYIFGSSKSKDSKNQELKTSIALSEEEIFNNRKTEVLAGGFIYRYPVTIGNTTSFANNISDAARFVMSAKTPQEKEERKDLFGQVAERETKLQMDALQRDMKREIAKKR